MQKNENENHIDLFTKSRLTVFAQATSYTIGFLIIFGGGGYLLDKQFQTAPTLFVIGLAISYPLTQILLYKKIKTFGKNKAKSLDNKSK